MDNFSTMTDRECPSCYSPLYIEEADDPMEDDLFVCRRCGWAGYEYEI